MILSVRICSSTLLLSAFLSACSAALVEPVIGEKAFRPGKEIVAPTHVNGLDDHEQAVIHIRLSPIMMRPVLQDLPQTSAGWPNINICIQQIPAGTPLASALDMVIAEAKQMGYHTQVGMMVYSNQVAANPLSRMYHVCGSMHDIVDRLAAAAKGIVTWRDGTLEVRKSATFVVPMPPVYKIELAQGLASTIDHILDADAADQLNETSTPGARPQQAQKAKTQVDQAARTIVYSADAGHEAQIEQFLDHLRHRPILLYEGKLWDVTLSDNNQYGINFSNLGRITNNQTATIQSGGGTSTSSGLNFQVGYAFGGITIAAVTNFLSNQGDIRTIAEPHLSLIAGPKACSPTPGNSASSVVSRNKDF